MTFAPEIDLWLPRLLGYKGWINRGRSVCRLGMVFLDAREPPELG